MSKILQDLDPITCNPENLAIDQILDLENLGLLNTEEDLEEIFDEPIDTWYFENFV